MEHKKAKHFKTKLCSYFHGNSTPCRFPDQQCMDIHNENIQPTDAGEDYRSRIPCKNGASCFFQRRPEGCFYKHATNVEQSPNISEHHRNTRNITRNLPSSAPSAGRSEQQGTSLASTPTINMNILVMNLSKQMEAISQKLQFLELKSMKDFPSLIEGQNRG